MTYLKGKDIKTQGDCLVYYMIKIAYNIITKAHKLYGRPELMLNKHDLYYGITQDKYYVDNTVTQSKPEGFEGW